MKKLVFAIACLLFPLFYTSCGVGTYSVSSGKEDCAYISIEANSRYNVVVTIDDQSFDTQTVKTIAHKTRRDIKNTAKYALKTTPGQHKVEITKDGTTLYSKQVFVSTGETKIIEL